MCFFFVRNRMGVFVHQMGVKKWALRAEALRQLPLGQYCRTVDSGTAEMTS